MAGWLLSWSLPWLLRPRWGLLSCCLEDEFLPEEARSCGLLCAGLDWDARPDEGLAGAAMASAGRMAARTARVLSFMWAFFVCRVGFQVACCGHGGL